jgi:chorismate synthase
MRGSENNDPFLMENGRVITKTNNCGGILGGISSGMPVIFRAAFKPTPSISRPQNSVDFKNMTEQELVIKGRHDPCVVPRAVPCVEAALNIALVSALSSEGKL